MSTTHKTRENFLNRNENTSIKNSSKDIVRRRVLQNENLPFMDPLIITKNLEKPRRYKVSLTDVYTHETDYVITRGTDMISNRPVFIKFLQCNCDINKAKEEYDTLCYLKGFDVPGIQQAMNYTKGIIVFEGEGECRTLQDEILKEGQLSIKQVVKYFRQISKTVRNLSRVGLEHKEINPSNKLISLDKSKTTVSGIASVKPYQDEKIHTESVNQSLGNILYFMLEGKVNGHRTINTEFSRIFDAKIGLLLEYMLNQSHSGARYSAELLYRKAIHLEYFYANDPHANVMDMTTKVLNKYIPRMNQGLLRCNNLKDVNGDSAEIKEKYLHFPLPPPYITGNGYVVARGRRQLNEEYDEDVSFVFMPSKPEESAKFAAYSRPENSISGLLKATCHAPEILITRGYDCTLQTAIQMLGPDEEQCLSYLEQIVRFAIEFQCYRGMVNLDIRPANILINLKRSQAVVCDLENVTVWDKNTHKHFYYGYKANTCDELMSYTFGLLLYSMVSRITDKDFLLDISKKSCRQLNCSQCISELISLMISNKMSIENIYDEVVRLRNIYSKQKQTSVATLFDKLNLES